MKYGLDNGTVRWVSLGLDWPESSFIHQTGGPAGDQVDHEAMTSPHSKEIHQPPRLSVASKSREGILPLCSALVGQFQLLGPVWAPQYDRDIDILERVQKRATELMKGLEHLTYERG